MSKNHKKEEPESVSFHTNQSVTSRRVKELKRAVLTASGKRERLPQPLFWSLFRSRLKDIKRTKERTRMFRDLFDGI